MSIAGRALHSAVRCSNCQFNALHVFASFAGLSLRPGTPPSTSRILAQSQPALYQRLSTTSRLSPETIQPLKEQEDVLIDDGLPEGELDSESQSTPSNTFVPWYLQVDTPKVEISPLFERQQLPDLPSDPPPLLQPMLEHISVQLGLDDLYLIDLRALDPPPALGGNLLMIVGTARSEKHLHVSADRFCRWLRTAHKLTPYADGLLGRNELKLKLRRKARRMKLLGSVGSSDGNEVDDGIRTGWVCVNVGMIEENPNVEKHVAESDDVVGFGAQLEGVKIVVQMLTEEKREELDLEGLWGATIARQQRKEAKAAEKLQESFREEAVGPIESTISGSQANAFLLLSRNRNREAPSLRAHSRALHTDAGDRPLPNATQEQLEYKGLDMSSVEPRLNMPAVALPSTTDNASHQEGTSSFSTQMIALQTHLTYLESLPRENAIEALGKDANDFDSTSFLTSFYGNIPLFPELRHWGSRLELIYHATTAVRHPGYTKKDIFMLVREMQASYIHIPPMFLLRAIKNLLTDDEPSKLPNDGVDPATLTPLLAMENLNMALEVLDDISLRGDLLLTPKVFGMLQSAIARARRAEDSDLWPQLRKDASKRLAQLMDRLGIYYSDDVDHIDVMKAFASVADWDAYWRHWRGIARHMQPRSQLLYQHMFQDVTSTSHQAMCVDALRDWIPMLDREEPRVLLEGKLATVVMDCLKVADPNLTRDVNQQSNERGQWVRLWRRCNRSINRSHKGVMTAFEMNHVWYK